MAGITSSSSARQATPLLASPRHVFASSQQNKTTFVAMASLGDLEIRRGSGSPADICRHAKLCETQRSATLQGWLEGLCQGQIGARISAETHYSTQSTQSKTSHPRPCCLCLRRNTDAGSAASTAPSTPLVLKLEVCGFLGQLGEEPPQDLHFQAEATGFRRLCWKFNLLWRALCQSRHTRGMEPT